MPKKILQLFLFAYFLLLPVFAHAQSFDYTPMERIPGFEGATSGTTDFYAYINAIYNFGIWGVGIAALLMISIGGYMYITSAGNNTSMEKAKGVITDAIIGLVLAMTSYLLLYIINPDLVKIQELPVVEAPATPPVPPTAPIVTGTCKPLTTGPCSVDNLKSTFTAQGAAEQASAICNAESGGRETLGSGVDICKPLGPTVSWGLFQFNITAHASKFPGCSGFGGIDDMFEAGDKECSMTNSALYNTCVAAAKNATNNIKAAYTLSHGGTKWGQWGANRKCKFPR